jgi:hypothetical protein
MSPAEVLGPCPSVSYIPGTRGDIDPTCLPDIDLYRQAFDLLLDCDHFFYSKVPAVNIKDNGREAKSLEGFEIIGPSIFKPKGRFYQCVKELGLNAMDLLAIAEDQPIEQFIETIVTLYGTAMEVAA